MKLIQLTKGFNTMVDDNMHELLCKNKWQVRSKRNYAACGKSTYMHRFIWEHVNGVIPKGYDIDHINGHVLDNQIENLRCVTRRENLRNKDVHRAGKLVGVHSPRFNLKKPYQAIANINGKQRSLGYFTTEQEAHEAYIKAINDVS